MDGHCKVNVSEGVPLNSTSTNIIVNGKSTKVTRNAAVIQIKPDKEKSSEFIEINTTLSIASSTKIKVFYLLNLSIGLAGLVVSCTVAYYLWKEVLQLTSQIEELNKELIRLNTDNLNKNLETKPEHSALKSNIQPPKNWGEESAVTKRYNRDKISEQGEPTTGIVNKHMEIMGEPIFNSKNSIDHKGLPIAQFNGEVGNVNLGTKSLIGPWVRDTAVSSTNSDKMIQLDPSSEYVIVKESGLYMIYAQVVYVSNAPSCYNMFARAWQGVPRLVASCTTGAAPGPRALSHAQLSCGVHAVARLHAGDTVNLAQREHNRTVAFRPGYTYMGFLKID